MPSSEARIAADRAPSVRAVGQARANARRDSLRQGTAGAAVSPIDDTAEVESRARQLEAELAPKSVMGRFFVGRLAELTVRVESCSRQQRAARDHRAAHAAEEYDMARLAEVDHAIGWLRAEPATHARKLRSMPEGVDRVIEILKGLGDEVNSGRWDWQHGERLAHLTGSIWLDVPVNRARALSEAIGGDFSLLLAEDGAGLSKAERIEWARDAMIDLLQAEVDALRAHRETLDLEGIEVDRATAADRALFDPSKEAILARRYEAASERGVYRALNELRRVEAQARASAVEVEAAVEPLGSSGSDDPEAVEEPESPRPAAPRPRPTPSPMVVRTAEGPQSVGMAARGFARGDGEWGSDAGR